MTAMKTLENKIDGWKNFPPDNKGSPAAMDGEQRKRARKHIETELLNNMLENYLLQRRWMGWIAIIFPFALLGLGYAFERKLQPSISDYYYALPGVTLPDCGTLSAACTDFQIKAALSSFPFRSFFCGGLIAVGVYLWIYKGVSRLEDWALNLAGALAIGVAVFPMGKPPFTSIYPGWAHFLCAASLFVCMWFVSRFCAKDTLVFMDNVKDRERYEKRYHWLARCMVGVLALGAVYYFFPKAQAISGTLFGIEALGVIIFGVYWVTKGTEIASHKFGR